MKNKMKIFGLFLLLLVGAFSLDSVLAEDGDGCNLNINVVNQDPYPAVPGSYVDVVFQVSGISSNYCDGVYFEIVPSYPFSLDEGIETTKHISGNTYVAGKNSDWTFAYTLRVAEDALNGNATLTVKYGENSAYITKDFDLEIEDSRTSFDAVIQDYTSEEVSIAIANTGKYTANSVVVRIPTQDGFTATLTDGQMVGNLDSGDYTIITFEITQDKRSEDNGLNFDVYYTDELGFRRVVNMELSVGAGGSQYSSMDFEEGDVPEDFQSMMQGRPGMRQSQGNSKTWIIWTSVILAIIVAGVVIMVILKKKRSRKKIKGGKSDSGIPDWIKNSKEKKKG